MVGRLGPLRDDEDVEQLVLTLVIAALAVVAAYVIQRRQRPAAPTRTGYNVPDHLDRQDFRRPDAAWLVAVFTSSTCETCAGVWTKAQLLESDSVATQELEVTRHNDIHKKYAINAVPATLIADSQGVVCGSFVGPVTATDLWATLAELRAPGSVPSDGCDMSGSTDA